MYRHTRNFALALSVCHPDLLLRAAITTVKILTPSGFPPRPDHRGDVRQLFCRYLNKGWHTPLLDLRVGFSINTRATLNGVGLVKPCPIIQYNIALMQPFNTHAEPRDDHLFRETFEPERRKRNWKKKNKSREWIASHRIDKFRMNEGAVSLTPLQPQTQLLTIVTVSWIVSEEVRWLYICLKYCKCDRNHLWIEDETEFLYLWSARSCKHFWHNLQILIRV